MPTGIGFVLAKRVIVLLTLSRGQLVRTKRFRVDRWYSLETFRFLGADEVVVVDVTPGGPDREGTARTIERVVSEAFLPVTVGGGLRTLDDAKWAFDIGADKLLSSDSSFINLVSHEYGAQAAVFGGVEEQRDWRNHKGAAINEAGGHSPPGEILWQSVERDGSLGGYDLSFLKPQARVPLVIGSGCGSWQHMVDAFNAGADGCATSNVLHFSEAALASCKRYLKEHGIVVRT